MKRRNFFSQLFGATAATAAIAVAKPTPQAYRAISQWVPFSVVQNSIDEQGRCTIVVHWPDTDLMLSDGSVLQIQAGKTVQQNLDPGQHHWFYWRISTSDRKTGCPRGMVSLVGSEDLPISPSVKHVHEQYEDGWLPQPVMTVTTPSKPLYISVNAFEPQALVEYAKQHPESMAVAMLASPNSNW